ncbi:MAG: hypothetical protein ACREJC_22800, partial [Tepidisphaeraceae bacterium]
DFLETCSMKRRGKSPAPTGTLHVHVAPPSGEIEPETPESGDADALEEAIEQFPEHTVAKVYRFREDGRKAYVMEGAPQSMTEARVAKAGPGEYEIVFWGPLGNGSNRNGFRGRKRIYVAPNGDVPAVSVPPVSSGEKASSLDTAVATMLMNMVVQSQQASQTMMTMLTTMMKDHSTMLGAQLQALGRPAADPLDTAERLTKILQPPTRGGFGDFLKDYQAFKELTGDDGGHGDEHWAAQIARAVAPHLLKDNGTPAPAPGGVDQEPPAARPSYGPPAIEPMILPPEPPMPNDLAPFAELLPKLRTACALGLSPETVADAILNGTDDDDTLERLLQQPGLVADIHRLAPDVPAEWLDTIRRLTLDALRESVGTDEADQAGDGDDRAAPGGG